MRSFSFLFAAFIFISSFSSVVWGQSEMRMRFSSSPMVDSTNILKLPSAETVEREAFELLNAERRSRGLSELIWDEAVASVARLHSQNMANGKFFSHQGPGGTMVDDRAEGLGLNDWSAIGENIAFLRGYSNPSALAVEKWMQSPAHRKNLLAPTWKESGIGVAVTADGTYYLTQVFMLRK